MLKVKFTYYRININLYSIGIISFNQSAAAVPPNVNMTFYCEATGISVYLEINDVPLFDIRDSSGIYSQRQNYAGLWVLSVAIQANSTNNKTKITCFVDTNHKEDRYLIVAGICVCVFFLYLDTDII